MQQFLPFRGTAWMIHQANKNESPSTKFALEKTMVDIAKTLAMAGQQTDCTGVFFEMYHYLLSHKVINISQGLGERLLQSKMSVHLEHLQIPWGIFEVCMESGLKIPGTDLQMPSCMVVAKLTDADMNALRQIAKRTHEFGANFQGVDDCIQRMFSIKYRDPVAGPGTYEGAMCHANFEYERIEGMSIDEAINQLPVLSPQSGMITPLSSADKIIQKHILQVVLGAICYLNTKDPDSGKYKFHDRPRLGNIPPSAILLGKNMERMPPGYHMREAHFRHLRHERFKRDDKGDVKVIWVRPAEIGVGRTPAGEAPKERTL